MLRLGVFNAKGLLTGMKKDFRSALAGIGAEAVVKLYQEGLDSSLHYVSEPERLLDLSKAIVAGVAATAAATFVAGLTSIVIVPIAVGLVVSVGVGCALDKLTDGDSMCHAAGRWLFSEPPEKTQPIQPPVLMRPSMSPLLP